MGGERGQCCVQSCALVCTAQELAKGREERGERGEGRERRRERGEGRWVGERGERWHQWWEYFSLTTITALLAVIIITAETEPNLCSFPPDLAKTTVHHQPASVPGLPRYAYD